MRMAAVADNEDLRLEGISIGVGLRVAPGITKAEAERFIKETAEAFVGVDAIMHLKAKASEGQPARGGFNTLSCGDGE